MTTIITLAIVLTAVNVLTVLLRDRQNDAQAQTPEPTDAVAKFTETLRWMHEYADRTGEAAKVQFILTVHPKRDRLAVFEKFLTRLKNE